MMDKTELLPCPFCGQQDAFVEQLDSDASVVICQGRIDEHSACLARGPVGVQESDDEDQPGKEAAIREWNRRAALTQQPTAPATPVATQKQAEVYAVRYLSHWDGEGDAVYVLAWKHNGELVTHEGGVKISDLLEYQGDMVLNVWPLHTIPAAEQPATAQLLAADHTGMRIDAHGTLGRIADGRYHSGLRFGCGEMLRHLEQMAASFYAGKPSVVDEFLQLYCLDEHRPKLKTKEASHA